MHRCTPAHSYVHPNPHDILCVLCPFSLGPCSVETAVCVSLLFTHTKKGSEALWDPIHCPPALLLVANKRPAFSLTWPRRGRRYRLEQRSPTPHPLTDPPRQTFFQVVGVEGGRGGCSKVFRLCEHAQEVFSRPQRPTPPTPPHPWSYNLAAPLPTSHARPLPSSPFLPLRQFSSNQEAGTFNLTECSRHLNYLTVVLVRVGVVGWGAG